MCNFKFRAIIVFGLLLTGSSNYLFGMWEQMLEFPPDSDLVNANNEAAISALQRNFDAQKRAGLDAIGVSYWAYQRDNPLNLLHGKNEHCISRAYDLPTIHQHIFNKVCPSLEDFGQVPLAQYTDPEGSAIMGGLCYFQQMEIDRGDCKKISHEPLGSIYDLIGRKKNLKLYAFMCANHSPCRLERATAQIQYTRILLEEDATADRSSFYEYENQQRLAQARRWAALAKKTAGDALELMEQAQSLIDRLNPEHRDTTSEDEDSSSDVGKQAHKKHRS